MKASLEIEIYDPQARRCGLPLTEARIKQLGLRRYWCAEVVWDAAVLSYQRRFLKARTDSHADSRPGVRAYFVLESDRLYEVEAPVWRDRASRYFCRVGDGGDIAHVAAQEGKAWLRQRHATP